jgi:hypothetical protein
MRAVSNPVNPVSRASPVRAKAKAKARAKARQVV